MQTTIMESSTTPTLSRPNIIQRNHAPRVIVSLIVVWVVCAMAACAASPHKASESAGAPTSEPMRSVDDLMGSQDQAHREIAALWRSIEEQRERGGMSEQISPSAVEAMSDRSLVDVRASCERPLELTNVCEDVCTLTDSICDNAESICRLAGELGDDAWASGKCDNAKVACDEATQRCCACAG